MGSGPGAALHGGKLRHKVLVHAGPAEQGNQGRSRLGGPASFLGLELAGGPGVPQVARMQMGNSLVRPVFLPERRNEMADDTTQQGSADRKRINTSEVHELRYWCERFGVSADELKRAVKKVGPMVDDVARDLGKART